MDSNDRQAIDGLFARLKEVERTAPPRDAEAEAFIRDRIGQSPAAPYFMAQTIVVQEQALNAAQARIEELEAEAQQGSPGGGLLGSLFGGGRPASTARGSVPRAGQRAPYEAQQTPWQRTGGMGGGFLAGAAQTAMGVAGGVLLGNAIAGMFGADEAQAAEQPDTADADADADTDNDAGADDGGFDGGDMGDMEF